MPFGDTSAVESPYRPRYKHPQLGWQQPRRPIKILLEIVLYLNSY